MLTHKRLFDLVSEDPTALPMQLAAAGKQDPVYFDEGLGLPVVLASDAINTVLRDEQTFSIRVFQDGLMKGGLIATSGEAHTRMRMLYNKFFTPRQLRIYEQNIVEPAVAAAIEHLAAQAQPDLIDDFCMIVPQRVVAALFGLPLARHAENDMLVRAMLLAIIRPFEPEIAAAGERAYATMAESLHEIAARELAEPSDNMLGAIAKTLIAEGNATVEACERIVFTLILGSYETTIWGIASTLAALLHHPEILAQVRDQPERIPAAIEESWRWCGSTTGTVRFVEQATHLAGHDFEPGAVIQCGWQAVHFDEALYPRPEVFDIDRVGVKTMIFSGGPHYCVGAPLARLETRLAIARLLARFPKLRLDPSRPAPQYRFGIRNSIAFGPENLPAVLD